MSCGAEETVRRAIVGLAGVALDAGECELLTRLPPAGVILFKRNCAKPAQIRALVHEVRAILGAQTLVLIDQEGGRVARLGPPHWPSRPAPQVIGRLAEMDREAGLEAAWLHARLLAFDLASLGIDVDCAPLLDLAIPGHTKAIGDRTLSSDPALVGALGQAMLSGFLAGGVLPVIKHLPGHGRATVDSHIELPHVREPIEVLDANDWPPFRACAASPFAMTAHVLYQALDPDLPATLSPSIIKDVIRGRLGFAGALMSDDLCMGALGGTAAERAAGAIEAGCDLALHCNGVLDGSRHVLEAVPALDGEAASRLARARAQLRAPQPFDPKEAESRLSRLLAGAPAPHA